MTPPPDPYSLSRLRRALLVTIVLATRCAALSTQLGKTGAAQKSAADVYYAAEVAERFTAFAAKRSPLIDAFHRRQQSHLQRAILAAPSAEEKALLEDAVAANEESRLDEQEAAGAMLALATSLKQAMGAETGATSCQYLTCGAHAKCAEGDAAEAARCRCDKGYEGNGLICQTPLRAAELPLFGADRSAQIADLSLGAVSGNRLALVYQNVTDGRRGYLVLGKAGHSGVSWGRPVAFSGASQAFGPVVAELQGADGGLAIAFRDRSRDGTGYLVGASLGAGPSGDLAVGAAKPFALHQAQRAALVPLPDAHVAALFAEHAAAPSGALAGGAAYGAAMMARVRANRTSADVELAGKRRFVSGAVARISAAALTPSSFVVAYRHGEDGSTEALREASCLVAQADGLELAFSRQPLLLEPGQGQIWARSVAAVRENVVAYTYHSGRERLTKQAFLQVDPATLQSSVLRKPEVLGRGFSPFVTTVSTSTALAGQQEPATLRLLQRQGPRLLTVFSEGAATQAKLCTTGGSGLPDHCKEVALGHRETLSVAGTQLSDGRAALVSTDARGVPSYHLVGLMGPAVSEP